MSTQPRRYHRVGYAGTAALGNQTLENLNYSTHAIESMRDVIEPLRARMPDLARVMAAALTVLEAVPKFQLPDGGRLVDEQSIDRLLQQARLPYPCVALEYRAVTDETKLSGVQVTSPKRIALVWDLRYGLPQAIADLAPHLVTTEPRESLLVGAFYAAPAPGEAVAAARWAAVPSFAEVALGQRGSKGVSAGVFRDGLRGQLPPERTLRNAMTLRANVLFVPRDYAEMAGGVDVANRMILADLNDEIWAALSFAALTSCANVEIETEPAPEKLNKKRKAAGKTPFFAVNRLSVGDASYLSRRAGGRGGDGTHASPRTHLRRGHIRMLEGRGIWVNAAVVNAGRDEAAQPRYLLEKSS